MPVTTASNITLAIGRPAALLGDVAQRLSDLRATTPLSPVDVVVGGVLFRPYLSQRLAEVGVSTLNLRLRTIGELGLGFGPPTADGATRLLPMAERQLAHSAAMANPGYFEPIAETPGFIDAVVRMMRELRMEGITPGEFAEWATSSNGIETAEKARALRDLYRRFDGLSEGYFSGATCLASADPAEYDGMAMFVFGVRQLAAAPRRLLRGLAERGIPITFLLPTVSEQADLALEPLLDWLVNECGATREDLDTPYKREPARDASALRLLKDRLFAPRVPVDCTDTSLRVLSAPSQESEAREAVRACLRWADTGVAFHEMAVVSRQVATYGPLLQEAFREAGIPVYSSAGTPLPVTPVGRQILRLLELARAELPRRGLIAFVGEKCMPDATLAPFGSVSASKWDKLSRSAGVVDGLSQWQANLAAASAADEAKLLRQPSWRWLRGQIAERRQLLRFVEAFQADVDALGGERTLAEHVDVITAFVEKYVTGGPSYITGLDEFRQVSELVGPSVRLEEFLERVHAFLFASARRDVDQAEPGRFMRRGVNLLDASQLPYLSFRAVCVVGLNEGQFPSSPRQDPLLLDDEREGLNAAACWTLPLRTRGHDPGPLQFGLIVHGAEEFLQLSYARAARAGDREMLPSAYVCQVLSALLGRRVGAEGVRHQRNADALTWVSSGRVAAADRSAALSTVEWRRALLQDDPALGRGLLFRQHTRAEMGEAMLDARGRADVLTPFDGVLADKAALALAAGHFARKSTSATRIARYAVCPRQFFLSSVLQVRVEEDPEAHIEMQASTRGTVIHAVLQEFLETHPADEINDDNRDALIESIYAIVDAKFDMQVKRGTAGREGLQARAHEGIATECVAWLEHMLDVEEFQPDDRFFLEVAFGGPSLGPDFPDPLADLVVPTAHGDITFTGYIDRLGLHADGTFSVLDYKTGKKLALASGTIGDGRDLQLPLYMLAGAQALGVPIERGTSAYEFVSQREGYDHIDITGEQFIAERARFQQVMNGIAGGVATGDFHAEPEPRACSYCDFKLLCGKQRDAELARKSGDPRIEAFRREVRGDVGDAT